MNIFLVDANPDQCAMALDDLRLNKMILETGQMLCSAYRHYAKQRGWPNDFDGIYKETHTNHPCTVWLKKDINNYKWAINLFSALYDEKMFRTNKSHLTYVKLFKPLTDYLPSYYNYPRPDFSFNCSNQNTGDVFNDYKQCLINKWKNDKAIPCWTKRNPPDWASLPVLKVQRIHGER